MLKDYSIESYERKINLSKENTATLSYCCFFSCGRYTFTVFFLLGALSLITGFMACGMQGRLYARINGL